MAEHLANPGGWCKGGDELCYAYSMDLSRRALLGAVGTLPLSRLARGATSAPAHRLTILHMNDFHSRHEAVNVRALSCTGGDGCFGGSARLAMAIRAQREAAQADGRTVLLLDGGDQFQGSLFFTKYRGMAELAVQHAVGTDAMGVGNHEFDQGPAVLAAYAEAARFPLVTSNVDTTAEPALDGRLRPWTILERGGLKNAVRRIQGYLDQAVAALQVLPKSKYRDTLEALPRAVGDHVAKLG